MAPIGGQRLQPGGQGGEASLLLAVEEVPDLDVGNVEKRGDVVQLDPLPAGEDAIFQCLPTQGSNEATASGGHVDVAELVQCYDVGECGGFVIGHLPDLQRLDEGLQVRQRPSRGAIVQRVGEGEGLQQRFDVERLLVADGGVTSRSPGYRCCWSARAGDGGGAGPVGQMTRAAVSRTVRWIGSGGTPKPGSR